MFGANLVILAQSCDELLRRQAEFLTQAMTIPVWPERARGKNEMKPMMAYTTSLYLHLFLHNHWQVVVCIAMISLQCTYKHPDKKTQASHWQDSLCNISQPITVGMHGQTKWVIYKQCWSNTDGSTPTTLLLTLSPGVCWPLGVSLRHFHPNIYIKFDTNDAVVCNLAWS